MTRIISNHRVAYESADHQIPYGTARDNNTNTGYIEEVEKLFNNAKIHYMDLGCAGGQLAVDFHTRGHVSVGLEGSDFGLKNHFANWPQYNESVLFTCDISKPFQLMENENPMLFDCISSWEFMEHISSQDLDQVFTNVITHLKPDGVFLGSTSYRVQEPYHQTVMKELEWREKYYDRYFGSIEKYPFTNKVREPKLGMSFYYFLKNPKK